MTDINITNENGTLVGRDPDTGAKVPIDMAALDAGTVRTERRFGVSRSVDLIAYKDGDETVVIDREGEIARDTDAGTALTGVDAAMSSAYHLHLTSGTYTLKGTYADGGLWRITTPGATVTGEGKASEVRWDPSTREGNDGAKLIEIREGADGVSFRDFFINGRMDRILSGGGSISNRNDGHNIAILNSQDFTMIGCYSWLSPGDGVEPGLGGGGNNCVIANNHFHRNWEQNVHLNGCNDNTVVGNVMDGEVNNACVHLFTSAGTTTERNVIVGNVIKGSENEAGIKSLGPGTHKDHVISGNLIYNNAGDGIRGGGENFVITNNQIIGNGGRGIWQAGNHLIANNIVRDNGEIGVSGFSGCVISNNRILNNGGQGIFNADQVTDYSVVGNDIRGNGGEGIEAKQGAVDATLSHNRIKNNGGDGILLRSGDAIDTVLVKGNLIGGNEREAIQHQTDQTSAANHRNVLIADNMCSDGQIRLVDRTGDGSGVMSRTEVRDNHATVTEAARLAVVHGNSGTYNAYSSPPPSPFAGARYLDDGTNRADGNVGYREYDGSAWVDIAG